MKHGQGFGIGLVGTLFFVVLMVIGYHTALEHFAGTSFRVFNYQVVITKCRPVFNDRVITIEKKIDKLKEKTVQ